MAYNPDTLKLEGIKLPMAKLAEAIKASGLSVLKLIEEDMTTQ